MKRLRSSRRFLSVLLAMVLCAAGVSPAFAQAEPPKFAASANSGKPGLRVNLSQVDPCPATTNTETQYIEASFTDAAGRVTVTQPSVFTDLNGNWNFPIWIRIPVRGISSLEPLIYTDGAALGAGTLKVRCFVPSTGRASEYAPQTFTVDGVSPIFFVQPRSIQPGNSIRISAADPCPVAGTRIDGVVKRNDVFLNFSAPVDPATRKWSVDVLIPKIYTPPMFPSKDFPLGLYSVSVTCSAPGQNLDAVYGADILNVQALPVRYAALGDSYSSGEGTFDYIDPQQRCHRSKKSYSYLLASDFSLGDPLLVACAGAITDDVFSERDGEPAQGGKLSSDNEVVTLTIGGNDALFGEVLNRCISTPVHNGIGCSEDADFRAKIEKQIAALNGKGSAEVRGRKVHPLSEVYQEIHVKAPRAKIYAGGYPDLFGWDFRNYTFTPAGYECWLVGGPTVSIAYKDALWINLLALSLNIAIGLEARKAARAGVPVTYVPASTFSGHGVCDRSDAWINGVQLKEGTVDPKSESFHPTVKGYDLGYRKAFSDAMGRR